MKEDLSKEATRFGSSQPGVASSYGTGETAGKKQPGTASIEINKARKAKGVDTVSLSDDRVADAGDAG